MIFKAQEKKWACALSVALLCLAVWVFALPKAVFAEPVSAKAAPLHQQPVLYIQDKPAQPNFFRFLFRRRAGPSQENSRQQRQSAGPARPAPIAQVEKDEDARRILVVGDFFAASLALGLRESYAKDPTIAVDESIKSASGFVRYDYFDWQAKLNDVLADEELGGRADLVIVMMGGNDRQHFRAPQPISLSAAAWRTAYRERVRTFAKTLSDGDFPVIWAGLPPVAGPKTSAHLQDLNTLYREEAEQIGARFIDIWAPFASEEGHYASSGPDVNGQKALLRLSDGFGFTRAGRAKLAFFVRRQIDRFLSGKATIAGTPGGMIVTKDGPALSLSGFALEDGNALLGGPALIGPPGRTQKSWEEISNAYNVLVRGVEMQPPEHRADNFSWPRGEN